MADWWLPDDPFAASVTLTWRRTTLDASRDCAAQQAIADSIPGVKWVVRGGAHWLTYQEPEGGRTTLVIAPNQLKWLRFGDVTWQHTFTAGEATESALHVGGKAIPVTMETQALTTDVTPTGGRVVIVARMTMGHPSGVARAGGIDAVGSQPETVETETETETLQTELTFLREDAPHGSQTPS